MNIASWPILERPREKLLSLGVRNLSDAELMAVVLQSGTKGVNALELSRQLLTTFGGIREILSADQTALCKVGGLGAAKFAQLTAVKELGHRYRFQEIPKKPLMSGALAAKEYLSIRYAGADREVFSCLFLDSQHQLLKLEELFEGTIDGAAVYPREVLKKCFDYSASAVIFAHNHPSGIAEPSEADKAITAKLKSALQAVDINVLDHLVIGNPHITSMAERGLL